MPMKKIAIEFEATVADARALARAVHSALEASRATTGTVYVEGFSMNPSDGWIASEPLIDIVER